MVTAEGSAERRVALIHKPREARKIFQFFSHHGHLDELLLHFRALLSIVRTRICSVY